MRWFEGVRNSFRYAEEGVMYALATQRNMQIHFLLAFLVMIFCLVLDVSRLEVILVFFAIILVVGAELANTAIESLVDLVTEDYHKLAKIAKDTAAAAVLLAALHAVIVGLLVFHDKLWPLQLRTFSKAGVEWYLVAMGPVMIGYFVIRTFITRKRRLNNERRATD
ncbi:diacylglycerol kinase [Effusibacillus lacus]|uniref:Diacylglycerol kinase n=1 Tax=Effusibacillus lacus TaxID=1348429 RepID=A0A292YRW2_9BACL|nr:diacylglycerol kinase [Effusibacillus lacus]TCS70359.1 diacylglycerol kinase [Effusibacillus lacus]GAX91513.1 diacylglycerol kinase [Effusibacillus lacus]